jgi:hypothetical protein
MSKDRRRGDHFGVIAAFEDLQVGAASQGGLDGHADLAVLERARLDFLDAQVFASVENGSFHEVKAGSATWSAAVFAAS